MCHISLLEEYQTVIIAVINNPLNEILVSLHQLETAPRPTTQQLHPPPIDSFICIFVHLDQTKV